MSLKVLITGCSGFIGKNAVKFFNNQKYEVFGIGSKSNREIKKNNFLKKNSKKIKIIDFLKKNKFNIIIFSHGSIDHKSNFEILYKDHFLFTKLIIDNLDRKNLEKIIFLSSADEYGTPLSLPINENASCLPKTNYGLIKNLSSNYILKSYSGSNYKHISIFILRLFLIYGENQKIPRLIPLIKNHLVNNKLLIINSKFVKRNFTHIYDLITFFQKIIKFKKKFKGIINFGSHNTLRITDIIKLIEKKYNRKLKVKLNNKKTQNKFSLYPDTTKLFKVFGRYKFIKIDTDTI